jgi:hypothetical protein
MVALRRDSGMVGRVEPRQWLTGEVEDVEGKVTAGPERRNVRT